MVVLLKMIRDITHKKKERKERVMTIVESDVKLFTIHQAPGGVAQQILQGFSSTG